MKELEPFGVKTLAMDVADDSSMTRGIQQILKVEKRIDILINNAGLGSYGAMETYPLQMRSTSWM